MADDATSTPSPAPRLRSRGRFQPRALRARLFLILAFALTPVLLLLAYETAAEAREARADAVEDARLHANQIVQSQQLLIQSTHTLLEGLAGVPAIQNLDADVCNAHLATVAAASPQYSTVAFADVDGWIRCSAIPANGTVYIGDRNYFQRAMASGDFAAGEYTIGRITGLPVVSFGHVVRDDSGNAVGVVFAALRLSWLDGLLAAMDLPPDNSVVAFDGSGRVIVRQPDTGSGLGETLPSEHALQAALGVEESVIVEAPDSDGVQRIWFVTPLRATPEQVGLTLGVGVPTAQVYAGTREDLVLSAVALLGAATLGGTLLWFTASRAIVRPVERLVESARNLKKGHLGARANLPQDGSELAELGNGFDEMAESIEAFVQRERQARVELESVNRELEAFAYSVSHDLRSPLRSIDGFSQSLVARHGSELSDEAKDDLMRIRRASQRMGRLIDDLLALSRLTRSEMRREDIDLSAMARDLVAELTPAQPTGSARVTIQPSLMVRGDRTLIRSLLQNLLSNALKFSAKKPDPMVEFGRIVKDGESVLFVRDNGAGFDMAHAAQLFAPFHRLHRADEFEGNGVGLATVQRIVHRHGGRVWAESSPDSGATFYFTLPQPLAPPMSERVAAPQPPKAMRNPLVTS